MPEQQRVKVLVFHDGDGRTRIRAKTRLGLLFTLKLSIHPLFHDLDDCELDTDGRMPDELALQLFDAVAMLAGVQKDEEELLQSAYVQTQSGVIPA